MQICEGDKELAVETSARLKELYPNFYLGILANNCVYPNEIEKYADVINTTLEDVFLAGAGGLAAHELLVLGLRMPGDVIVKIDADTKIHKTEISDFLFSFRKGMFGKMQEARFRDYHGKAHSERSINGGALGIKRSAARFLVDNNVLLDEALVYLTPGKVSAYVRGKLEGRANKKALSSHDWTLAWACGQHGIPMEYDSRLLEAFEHSARFNKSITELPKSRLLNMYSREAGTLRDQLLSENNVDKQSISDFLRVMWGDDGVVICKKDQETRHMVKETFTDLAKAIEYAQSKDSQHLTVTARPYKNDGTIQMITLDIDANYDASFDASTIETSNGRYHVYFLLEPSITKERATQIIENALFCDIVGSIEASVSIGCRVPATPSYRAECLLLHDKCEYTKRMSGKVRLVKNVDKYYTEQEVMDAISQISKVCKARPLETREALVLL